MAERTDIMILFQRDGVQERKALASVLVSTVQTDRLLSLLISVNGIEVMLQEWSEGKQAKLHEAYCRSTN